MEELRESFWVDICKPPNVVTATRLILSPLPGLMVFCYDGFSMRIVAAVLFGLIAITDLLDGYLARKLNMITKLGIFMDPIVDKVLVSLLLIGLSFKNPTILILLAIFCIYYYFVSQIIKRVIKSGGAVAPTIFGKVNMFCQDLLMILLILPLPDRYQIAATAFVVGMAFFSFISYKEKYS